MGKESEVGASDTEGKGGIEYEIRADRYREAVNEVWDLLLYCFQYIDIVLSGLAFSALLSIFQTYLLVNKEMPPQTTIYSSFHFVSEHLV